MKINRNTVIWGIFAALQLFTTYSAALTLGRLKGAALLGKELDLSVLVQYASDEDVSATCFDADLSYGDTPLERGRFSVSAEPGAQANTQRVRVQSAMRVDDAVVRLNLKTVCGPKASRSYVLLSDVVSELADALPVAQGASAGKAAANLPAAGGVNPGRDSAPNAATVVRTPKGAKGPAKTSKPKGESALPSPSSPAVASSTVSPTARSRVEVSAAVLEELQKRIDELEESQTIKSSTGDAQNGDIRAKELEAGIRELQLLTAKNQQNLQLVATAVESTTSQSYGRTLVFLLLALLLACVAALAIVMNRLRSGGFRSAPWWTGGDERAPMAPAAASAPAASAAARAQASIPVPLVADRLTPTALGAVTAPTAARSVQLDDSGFDALATVVTEHSTAPLPIATVSPAKPKTGRPDFTQSGHGTLRAINTREMLDVRQQAEFFMALGQHDQAVQLLESSIQGSADANPLVYLDLLKILHTLSRRADFERYREEFNLQFTGRIAEYADFLEPGNGLEAYEEICHQIVVLWPTEYTIDFIEQCLVRTPEDDPEQGMDLEAFRDLLLLYGVLKRLDQFYDSSRAPFSASRAANSQLVDMETAAGAQTIAPLPTLPGAIGTAPASPVSMDIELDFDLDSGIAQAPKQVQGNLIDFDVSGYTDSGKPATDK